jgi:dihydroflavonol-4-reductase
LVTGGSGYLGGWCIADLLGRGYQVRTTVRDLKREDEVRTSVATQIDPGDRLEFVAADLLSDAGWPEAVAGCDYVLHVASPFPPAQPKDPDELIVPARDGALRVIDASLAAGVKRVVMTSSIAAVRHGKPPASGVYTEADFSDGDDTSLTPYVRSKTIAEKAAWDNVRAAGNEDRLAIVNPGAIIGPVLGSDLSYSLELAQRLLKGMPAMPRLGFSLVDVRDVADMHIRAMTEPAAGGERFLATGPFMWMKDVAQVLRDRLGPAASKVPKRVAPDILIKTMARFDPGLRSVVGDLGESSAYSTAKAESTLGWKARPVEDTIADCGTSLIERGLVA